MISGSGTLTLAGGNETLAGSNTFTGITTIAGGTLVLSNPTNLATSSVPQNNGTLDVLVNYLLWNRNIDIHTMVSRHRCVFVGHQNAYPDGAADTFAATMSGAGGLT